MSHAPIGQYQILRELGRGGMGEVFLARDTRLERNVAIKALPSHLAQDPDRLARFQREARVLASLNHPGIGAIYGLEEANGLQYLILEFIEGETLAERLVSGAIGVDEALHIAKQIAEALEVAHEKGVIHRDLKPGNVMVTEGGIVKVLDFGLARTAEGSPSTTQVPGVSPGSPTVTSPAPVHSPTIPGAIMGTAGYMSPEQARGKPVDKRSDIFSFGCILYEMLTGNGPFPGETVTDSLGAILHRDPEWTKLPASVPPRVRELLRNCLAKDRRSRLHDIADARLEIERTLAGHDGAAAELVSHAGKNNWVLRIAGVCAIAAIAAAASWQLARRTSVPATVVAPQPYYLSASVPPKPELEGLVGITPDSRSVVYKAWTELESDSVKPGGLLAVRQLDRDESTLIEGSAGVLEAALSPDGRWIAFVASKDRTRSKLSLKKVAIERGRAAGVPETLCELPTGGVPTICWASDREIVLALSWQQTILAVPAAGGEPRMVLHEEQSAVIDNWGEVRPLVGGRSIFATRWSVAGQTVRERTEIVDITTGKRKPLLGNAGGMQYLPGGFVLARRNQNSLIAARFDLEKLELIGEPVTVWSGRPIDNFSITPSGTLSMITRSGQISERRLAWMDEQGRAQPLAASPRAYGAIQVSPDGGRVAVNLEPTDASDLPSDLWVHDFARRTFTRVPTDGPAWEFIWSPDGQRLTHNTVSKDGFAIWDRRIDGASAPVKLYSPPTGTNLVFPTSWSPDGKTLAMFTVDLAKDAAECFMLQQGVGATEWIAHPYVVAPQGGDYPRFSPDGKWLRFTAYESGRRELYIQPFSGATSGRQDAQAGRIQVSSTGITGAEWCSADGKEIRYIDGESQVMSVQIQMQPTLSASVPKPLYSFKGTKLRSSAFAPDGKLLVVLEGPNERPNKIDVVVNFLEEVRAKLPVAN